MLTMIGKRLMFAIPSLIGVVIVTFLLTRALPGDPAAYFAGPAANKEAIEQIRKKLGFDKPLIEQFFRYTADLAHGDLGNSLTTGQPVATEIRNRLPASAELTLLGLVVSIVIAIPLGVLAAVKRGTWIDTAVTIGSLAGVAVPMMVLASLLVLVFSADLAWLPGPTELGASALILPAIAVGTHLMAMLARMTRGAMLEVLGEDYIRTARAKGVPERRVLFVHALRNALLPVITVAGLQFGSLLSGAIIVEKVFARPGVGTTLLDAIAERDYPVVQGTVLVIAVTYVVVNILVDVAYGLIDPRIRVS